MTSASVRAEPAATSAEPTPPAPSDEWRPADNDALDGHHLRSLTEMGSALALWSVLYWLMMDRNVADWDNPEPLERFDGRAWRLDNNSLGVNWIAHPLMGGAAYGFARANHHDPAVAFGYSFLTSFLWEFVLEFKEKVSVNDFIATPGTGIPVGEFLYKLGLYLDSGAGSSVGLDAARWSLGLPVSIDRALDGRPPPTVHTPDNLGLTKQIWHHFGLTAGALFVESPGVAEYTQARTSLDALLVTLPGYLDGRARSGFFHNAEISSFSLGGEASHHGSGLALAADTLLAGYHAQALAGTEASPRGLSATLGVSVAFRYLRSKANRYDAFVAADALPDPDLSHHVPLLAEQFAAFHMPGPAVDWHALSEDVAVHLSARAHPDFVGFGAPAFYDWAAANLDEKGKHILHRQGYFHGWGASGELAGRLKLGPVRASADLFYGRYRSQDGLDRHIERITVDVPARGSLLRYGVSVGVRPPLLPLTLAADFAVRRWYSRAGGFERSARAAAKGFSATLEF